MMATSRVSRRTAIAKQYFKALFYALVVFLKKVGVIQKSLNEK
jgi:hypothetical protein